MDCACVYKLAMCPKNIIDTSLELYNRIATTDYENRDEDDENFEDTDIGTEDEQESDPGDWQKI